MGNLLWRRCTCSWAILGKRAGFATKVTERANERITFTHSVKEKETLAAKRRSFVQDIVLRVVKIIDLILKALLKNNSFY